MAAAVQRKRSLETFFNFDLLRPTSTPPPRRRRVGTAHENASRLKGQGFACYQGDNNKTSWVRLHHQPCRLGPTKANIARCLMEGTKNKKCHYYKTQIFIPVKMLSTKQAPAFAMSNENLLRKLQLSEEGLSSCEGDGAQSGDVASSATEQGHDTAAPFCGKCHHQT